MPGRPGARIVAVAVHPWPGPLPAWGGEVLVISIVHPAGATREAARAAIRAAACEALAQSLGIAVAQVVVESSPGKAPRLVIDGKPSAIGLSISHDGALSLAAVNPRGAIGIDLMEVKPVSDWARVAHDYLGMAIALRLIALPAAALPRAFAQAWCEREAHLKLLGQPLAEWTPSPADCRLVALALPEGFAGAVAVAV
ncbi:MAG TPA: 4'-phosphopantetheinyl transferase superfamily protein [Telluria sp.]|nr:4'-phosphopantetheinyl transferase superfamily protein [Telluria sp.]